MKVAVLVPMLGRPHRIEPLVSSLRAVTPDARVVFGVTPTDTAVLAELDRLGEERVLVPFHPVGDYARKINVAFNATEEPLVFTGADDLYFHPGWLKRAAAYVEPGIGVIGTNDLGAPRVLAGRHATHSLVTRDYVERFGTIDERGKVLHEGYPHEYCDDELVETAKHRRAWAMAMDSLVEHLHPSWNKADPDAMYDQQGARMRLGRPIYRSRRQLWT